MARTSPISDEGGVRAALVYYEPAEELAAHAHAFGQASCLLAGGYREESNDGIVFAERQAFGIKPSGYEHANMFGPHGALIFSVSFRHAEIARYYVAQRDDHRPLAFDRARRLSRRAHLAIRIMERFRKAAGPQAEKRPGDWLAAARAQLVSGESTIGYIAKGAGFAPSSFSRAFQAAIGVPPQTVRHFAKIERAIRDIIITDDPLGEIAIDAGFADQPHMTRDLRRTIGLTPGRLRAMMSR